MHSNIHTYRWITSLKALGLVDTTVTANVLGDAVFNDQAIRNYVAYNPTDAGIEVRFSDGYEVPAKAMVTNGRK